MRVMNARDHRRDFLPVALPAHRQGRRAAAGVAVPQHDQVAPSGVGARRGDGGLVCLRAGAGEKRLLQVPRRDLRQFLRQVRLRLVRVQRRGVIDLFDLIDDRLDDFRIGVADRNREHPAEGVEVFIALIVPHPGPLALHQGDRLLVVHRDGGEEMLLVLTNRFRFAHSLIP